MTQLELAAGKARDQIHRSQGQSLQQKHGIGILIAYLRNYVFPGRYRNHVAGVASKTIDATVTPR